MKKILGPAGWRGFLLDLLFILLGTVLVGLPIAVFTVPNDIAPGGVSGLATALAHLTPHISVGAWALLLNAPLLLACWKQMGLRALVLTLLVTEVINNLIFNGDRVLLNLALDGTAVSLYYQASLLGKTMALVATPLNSVLIGYLARYRGGLDRKLMGITAGGSLGLLLLATAGCTLASHILIRLLYAQNYELVRGYFWVANAAQAAYFLSNIAATVLLRYCRIRYQLYINIVYAAGFCALCIPAALAAGLDGFCGALLAVCLIRLGTVLALGYRSALTGKGLAGGSAAENPQM